jgi:hypothetical protein
MTDVVEKMISLDRIPERLGIPSRRLDAVHLRNKPPHNPKKRENDYVVKYTVVSPETPDWEVTRRNRVYA